MHPTGPCGGHCIEDCWRCDGCDDEPAPRHRPPPRHRPAPPRVYNDHPFPTGGRLLGPIHQAAQAENITFGHRPGGCYKGGRCEEHQKRFVKEECRSRGVTGIQGYNTRQLLRISRGMQPGEADRLPPPQGQQAGGQQPLLPQQMQQPQLPQLPQIYQQWQQPQIYQQSQLPQQPQMPHMYQQPQSFQQPQQPQSAPGSGHASSRASSRAGAMSTGGGINHMSMMGGSRFGGEPREEHGHRNRHGGSERMDGSRYGGSAAGGRPGRDIREDRTFGFEGGFRQRRY